MSAPASVPAHPSRPDWVWHLGLAGYGVMSTPAVVVDGKVTHKGSVPGREQVQAWLA
ncbi:thioredoxin family protein [Amaricoccus solimangrovi]|uniref:thioredoxin family protein n=1 Tax=Amaricoccus solimangrovi TaxID=2589815 RepID=UPI001F19C03A|nr:thioredoxin family protein [Amaricoccus solimangrovi]